MAQVVVYDPTHKDQQSKVRGIGRYLQILRETFPQWIIINSLHDSRYTLYEVFLNPFFNFLAPPLFIGRKFKKQIAVIHDLIPLKYPIHFSIGLKGSLNVLLNKIALSNYDVVITDSVQSKKDIIAILGISEKKVRVVYPCLPEIFFEKSKIQNPKSQSNYKFKIPNSKFLLYVGDATWNKNLVNLAKAIKMQELPCIFVGKVFDKKNEVDDFFRLGKPKGRGTHWRKKSSTSGNPWNEEFNEFMSLAENDTRFIFPGFISDEELIFLYKNAFCNLLISHDEGFGFSYLEASSLHCPSILSDIPVLREISDSAALFANPEDPQSIVFSILSLKNDPSLRNKLIKQSHERSLLFTNKKFKSDFLSAIS